MSTVASRTLAPRTQAFRTLDGSTVNLERTVIGAALGTDVLFPDSAGYSDARAIWNAMIERQPAAIVRAATETDVIKAVTFARANRLLLGVKGGGHNIAGNALVEGGLVIDLSPMRKIAVDAAARIARVEPGATLADVDRATQQHGLVVPTGINSTTGIAGLTLGGGFGWTTRKFGLTIDNLVSARVVTADGEIARVDRERHPDLYWAIRGGGGNFGVVTEFEFALHPVGPEVVAGMVVHPFADFAPVLKQYQAALARASDDLTCWAVMRKAPPLPFLPAEWHGREIVVLAMCHVGPRAEAEAATAELRKIGKPIADIVGPMPFVGWQSAFDPLLTPGARNYWKSHDVAAFSDTSIEILHDAIATLPTEECEVFIAHVGRRDDARAGRGDRVAESRAALRRERAYALARREGRRALPQLGTGSARAARPACDGQRLRELHPGRRGTRERRVRPQLRAARGDQAALRPGQSVPDEPEHRAALNAGRKASESQSQSEAPSHSTMRRGFAPSPVPRASRILGCT